jgi:hypothetical protein
MIGVVVGRIGACRVNVRVGDVGVGGAGSVGVGSGVFVGAGMVGSAVRVDATEVAT